MAKTDQTSHPGAIDEAEVVEGTRGFVLPSTFVLRGCDALLAFMKSAKYQSQLNSSGNPDLLESEKNSVPIHVNFNLWVIPKRSYYAVKISNLPYDIHGGVSKRICLIVPNKETKTSEETIDFFKRYARSLNKIHDFDVITWKDLQPRIVSFEDKRQLVRTYDMFITDASLKGFLIAKLGKVFKRAKKMPVNIALHRPTELKRVLSGTQFFLHNDGNNYSYLIGHSRMKSKELRDNIVESLSQLAKKVPNGWRNIRSAGIMGQGTAFIPVYDSSDVSHFNDLSEIYKMAIVNSHSLQSGSPKETIDKEKTMVDVLLIRKGNKHLSRFSKISELKEKVLKLSQLQSKKTKDDMALITAPHIKSALKGVTKRKKNMKTGRIDTVSKDSEISEVKSTAEKVNQTVKAAESQDLETGIEKYQKLRSTSDAAVMKTEKRKLKRNATDMVDVQLTNREIRMLGESPKKKKPKYEQSSPNLTGYEKYTFKDKTTVGVKGEKLKSHSLPSPKFSGYDKYLFQDKEIKKKEKSKAPSEEKLTGYEKFIMSEESNRNKRDREVGKNMEDTVEIPEQFFNTETDRTREKIAHVSASAKKKTPAAKRTQRMSLAAENTPLRRSSRIHSTKN